MNLKSKMSAGILLASLIGAAMPATASAEETVNLFKIVTVKDEIVIGLTPADMDRIANAGEEGVSAVARTIVDAGQMPAWQFAVRKGADGELEQAPHQRVSLIGHESLRVEPYRTNLRVVAPE